MKKLSFIVLLLAIISFGFSINILIPVGPTTISMSSILSNKIKSQTNINVEFWKNMDQITSYIISKKVDILLLPVSFGATLYAKGYNIKLAAITLWKGFYILGRNKVDNLKDIKEIYTPQGKGQTADVVLRYLMSEKGLKEGKDYHIKYASPQTILALFASNKIKYALLPEPFVSLVLFKVKDAKILFSLSNLFNKEKGIPITGVFVTNNALEKYPVQVGEALSAIKESVIFAKTEPDSAVKLSLPYLKSLPEKVLDNAMKRMTIDFDYSYHVKKIIFSYIKIVGNVNPAVKEINNIGGLIAQ
jgi:NitT/TauT family transport system substrate-binding protein